MLLHGLLSEVTSDKPVSNVRFQSVSSRRVPPGHEFVFGNLAIVMGIDTFKYTPGFRFGGKWDSQHSSGILEVDEIDVPVSCHVKGMKEITNIRDSAVDKENESGTIKKIKHANIEAIKTRTRPPEPRLQEWNHQTAQYTLELPGAVDSFPFDSNPAIVP